MEENKVKIKPNGLGIAGAILSIIGSSFFLLMFLIFGISLLIGGFPLLGILFLLIFGVNVLNIIVSGMFLVDYNKKILAGVLGIIFGGILGGIFILVSDSKK